MQSANNQSAHSYSNGAAAVFGGWVWPADSSCLLSCRGFVTSTMPFALSDYAIRLVIVQHGGQKCQTLNKANQSLQCYTLIAKKNTRYPSDPVSCSNSTKWPVYWREERKEKKKSPRAIMHLSQQQVELQSQSFIFNFIRVSGQTNVLLISSLLLLKRGRTVRGRKLDYRE